MGVDVLVGPDGSQTLITSAVVACQVITAAVLAARAHVDNRELRRALRTLLVSLRVYR